MISRIHIAVIDDDEGVRRAIDSLLQSCGYDALAFESMDTFLDSTHATTTDCIVSDIQMLGRSGLDLCRDLRKRSVFTPVILMSAVTSDFAGPRATKAGANAYLEKPFDSDALLMAVEEAVSGAGEPRRVVMGR